MDELKQLLESAGISSDVTARVSQIHESQVKAAVQVKLDEAVAQIQESAEQRFEARVDEAVAGAVATLAAALQEATNQFFAENGEALVESARNEMAIAAIAQLHESFAILNLTGDAQLAESVEKMRQAVDLKESEIKTLRTELAAINEAEDKRAKGALLAEATQGMTDVSADRFTRLVESMGACTVDQFTTRLSDLKETFKALTESVAPGAPNKQTLTEGAGAGVDNAAGAPEQKQLTEGTESLAAQAARYLSSGRLETPSA
ncbi:gp22 prohead core scaffold protein [Delftia phage PhiW-14]|uniref:Gp22 prohead core scaffold protein n=1 Tax=Delftia phage PhiW-14 TaxID=665032 RepID=C9DG11_BPW14|nr:gp22 prohead core scaffold protein [Delftia phage PhiW-14]ACV50062.1 gp22 prohead core scaffold protein [Delftia phage PhiW-14]